MSRQQPRVIPSPSLVGTIIDAAALQRRREQLFRQQQLLEHSQRDGDDDNQNLNDSSFMDENSSSTGQKFKKYEYGKLTHAQRKQRTGITFDDPLAQQHEEDAGGNNNNDDKGGGGDMNDKNTPDNKTSRKTSPPSSSSSSPHLDMMTVGIEVMRKNRHVTVLDVSRAMARQQSDRTARSMVRYQDGILLSQRRHLLEQQEDLDRILAEEEISSFVESLSSKKGAQHQLTSTDGRDNNNNSSSRVLLGGGGDGDYYISSKRKKEVESAYSAMDALIVDDDDGEHIATILLQQQEQDLMAQQQQQQQQQQRKRSGSTESSEPTLRRGSESLEATLTGVTRRSSSSSGYKCSGSGGSLSRTVTGGAVSSIGPCSPASLSSSSSQQQRLQQQQSHHHQHHDQQPQPAFVSLASFTHAVQQLRVEEEHKRHLLVRDEHVTCRSIIENYRHFHVMSVQIFLEASRGVAAAEQHLAAAEASLEERLRVGTHSVEVLNYEDQKLVAPDEFVVPPSSSRFFSHTSNNNSSSYFSNRRSPNQVRSSSSGAGAGAGAAAASSVGERVSSFQWSSCRRGSSPSNINNNNNNTRNNVVDTHNKTQQQQQQQLRNFGSQQDFSSAVWVMSVEPSNSATFSGARMTNSRVGSMRGVFGSGGGGEGVGAAPAFSSSSWGRSPTIVEDDDDGRASSSSSGGHQLQRDDASSTSFTKRHMQGHNATHGHFEMTPAAASVLSSLREQMDKLRAEELAQKRAAEAASQTTQQTDIDVATALAMARAGSKKTWSSASSAASGSHSHHHDEEEVTRNDGQQKQEDDDDIANEKKASSSSPQSITRTSSHYYSSAAASSAAAQFDERVALALVVAKNQQLALAFSKYPVICSGCGPESLDKFAEFVEEHYAEQNRLRREAEERERASRHARRKGETLAEALARQRRELARQRKEEEDTNKNDNNDDKKSEREKKNGDDDEKIEGVNALFRQVEVPVIQASKRWKECFVNSALTSNIAGDAVRRFGETRAPGDDDDDDEDDGGGVGVGSDEYEHRDGEHVPANNNNNSNEEGEPSQHDDEDDDRNHHHNLQDMIDTKMKQRRVSMSRKVYGRPLISTVPGGGGRKRRGDPRGVRRRTKFPKIIGSDPSGPTGRVRDIFYPRFVAFEEQSDRRVREAALKKAQTQLTALRLALREAQKDASKCRKAVVECIMRQSQLF